MEQVITCLVCPNGCQLCVKVENEKVYVEGNLCNRGEEFAINELKNPKRTVCTTVKTIFEKVPRLSVRTEGEILKGQIEEFMMEISKVVITKPVSINEVVIENVINSGINVIATTDLKDRLGENFMEEFLENNNRDYRKNIEKAISDEVKSNSE